MFRKPTMPEMSKNHATALRIMARQWRSSATMLRMVKQHNMHMPGRIATNSFDDKPDGLDRMSN